ncbi:hypothetical protein WICMUC_000117 [Wickerhamomyces mucosus]|uniref:Uncharacterized protein n=1 Tax=Wickerhamomyces mucosus TaxID=1378264 RepID=A0A9P8TJN6_9ASCO|nr:hypothetical protein WICMUC_000117 [Wickerhamomyces mucosus]
MFTYGGPSLNSHSKKPLRLCREVQAEPTLASYHLDYFSSKISRHPNVHRAGSFERYPNYSSSTLLQNCSNDEGKTVIPDEHLKKHLKKRDSLGSKTNKSVKSSILIQVLDSMRHSVCLIFEYLRSISVEHTRLLLNAFSFMALASFGIFGIDWLRKDKFLFLFSIPFISVCFLMLEFEVKKSYQMLRLDLNPANSSEFHSARLLSHYIFALEILSLFLLLKISSVFKNVLLDIQSRFDYFVNIIFCILLILNVVHLVEYTIPRMIYVDDATKTFINEPEQLTSDIHSQ